VQQSRIALRCRKCGKPAEHVYYRFRIPKRDDANGWIELLRKVRPFNRSVADANLDRLSKERLRVEHQLETCGANREARMKALRFKLRTIDKELTDWRSW
jgi:hypothetical protein